MHLLGTELILSASDLSNFLSCRHRTALDMAVAVGDATRPFVNDPLLKLLWQRGIDHERRYVESLRDEGLAARRPDRHLGMPKRVDENARGNAQRHRRHRPGRPA